MLAASSDPVPVARPDLWWRAAEAVRASLRASVAHRPDDQRALVPALVVGDDSDLDPRLAEDFRATGMTHLLAVSGTNLTLVVGFLLVLGRWCGVRGRGHYVVGALGIVGFVLLARTEPSVVRAAAMGAVGLVGMGVDGRRRGPRALGVAVVVLLLLDPGLALTVGFALSAVATAGILLVAPGLRDALARWLPRWVAEAVAVPLAAQLACTPLVAAISGQVSLVAVAANLAAAPAVGPATVLGLLGGLAGLVADPLGRAARHGRGLVCRLAGRGRRARCRAAAAGRRVGHRAVVAGAADAARGRDHRGAAAAAAAARDRSRLRLPGRGPGAGPAARRRVAARRLGARRLRRRPGRRAGGADRTGQRGGRGRRSGCRARRPAASTGWVSNGCRCSCSPTRTPITSTVWPGSRSGRQVGEVETHADAPYGATRVVGEATLQVLWPPPGHRVDNPNDASVVLLAEVRGVRMLLTGDVEPPSQLALERTWPGLDVDVVKVPHHGSRFQDTDWLLGLGASLALVSAGADNDYGHPAPATLAAFEGAGVDVRRTDLDGDLAVVSEDGGIAVATTR